MSSRISNISGHLSGAPAAVPSHGTRAGGPKLPDDVVICGALRTPLCKGGRGAFRETHPEWLLTTVLKALIEKTGVDPKIVQDIQAGNVLIPGAGISTTRMAALYAGFPESTAVVGVNRQCSSGIATVANVASAISSGFIDVGVGAGYESMSMYYGAASQVSDIDSRLFENPVVQDVLLTMGQTSENVAKEFNITREIQDKFAFSSHTKAAEAAKKGLFDEEIVPVTLQDGTVVTKDDGIRPTTLATLNKLRPAFGKDGRSTAGNSSQVSDGAAAVLLARRSVAEKYGLPILARFVGFTVVGVPPRIMGIGPEKAIPEVLRRVGLTIDDIDIYEINEAFASQAVFCVDKLGIDINKVNPKGGAIAFGHPLGCTGSRQVATLLPELRRQKKKYGVISMCVGVGMGAAAVIENEVL